MVVVARGGRTFSASCSRCWVPPRSPLEGTANSFPSICRHAGRAAPGTTALLPAATRAAAAAAFRFLPGPEIAENGR